MASESQWATAVGRVDDGVIEVRGYSIAEIISNLSFSEATYLTIRGERPSKAQARVFDAALCGILEHAFYTPTTLAARMVASAAPNSIIPGLAAGILTVGSVTVSPQHSAEIIVEVFERTGDSRSASAAADELAAEMVATRRRMPGVGHPLHPEGDPRAKALAEVAKKEGVWGERCEAYHAVHSSYTGRLGKSLPVNIDGMLGCVLSELGFTPLEMPGIASMSFMPGMIAHSVEEANLRPPRLRIANGEYVGVKPRSILNGE